MNKQGTRASAAWRRATHGMGIVAGVVWAQDLLAAPAKPAQKLVNVADTRDMVPGFSHWLADVYNENLWWYGAVVVATMVVMGLGLGIVADRLVGLLGIDLGKLKHHE
jgi:hypothetical protein